MKLGKTTSEWLYYTKWNHIEYICDENSIPIIVKHPNNKWIKVFNQTFKHNIVISEINTYINRDRRGRRFWTGRLKSTLATELKRFVRMEV